MCSKCPPPPPNLGIQNSCNAVWHWPMPHGISVHHISPKLLMINHPTNVQTGPTSDEAISCYQVSVCLSVCLSICHKPVFCQNSWMYLHASNVWWLLGTLGEFADSWNPISKPNSALICHIQLKLWSLLWNSLLFSAKIWLPWQCPLDPCDQKYLLWIGRPLPRTIEPKSLSITVIQAYLSPFSRYVTLTLFSHRSNGKN